jgi:hypothetical protein
VGFEPTTSAMPRFIREEQFNIMELFSCGDIFQLLLKSVRVVLIYDYDFDIVAFNILILHVKILPLY